MLLEPTGQRLCSVSALQTGFVLLSTLMCADCTVLTAIVRAWGIVVDWAMLGRDGREIKKKTNTRASRGTGRDWSSSSRTLVVVFSSRSTPPLLHHHKCTSLLIQQSLLSVWLSWCAKPCRNVKDCEIKFYSSIQRCKFEMKPIKYFTSCGDF